MKKVIVWTVLFFILTVSASWGKEEKPKIPKGLKTTTEKIYEFTEKSGKYEGVLQWRIISTFDTSGNMIESSTHDGGGKLKEKQLYKYDNKGNRIDGAWYDGDGKLKWLYKYDDKGDQIEQVRYGADGRLKWKYLYKHEYDEKGNRIGWALYDADRKLKKRSIYQYDGKGNIIENIENKTEERFGKIEEIPVRKYVYAYEFYPEGK